MDKKKFKSVVWKELFDGTVCERSFINGITRAKTSVIDEWVKIFAIRIGIMKIYQWNFKDDILE